MNDRKSNSHLSTVLIKIKSNQIGHRMKFQRILSFILTIHSPNSLKDIDLMQCDVFVPSYFYSFKVTTLFSMSLVYWIKPTLSQKDCDKSFWQDKQCSKCIQIGYNFSSIYNSRKTTSFVISKMLQTQSGLSFTM